MADISVIKMPNNLSYNLKDAAARESIAALPTDVLVDGTSILSNTVANIPVASVNTLGVVKIDPAYGIDIGSFNKKLAVVAANSSEIKEGNNIFRLIATSKQHEAVFYGLAKAAGDATLSASSNAVGTYTDDAKGAIQTMLGAQAAIEVIRL